MGGTSTAGGAGTGGIQVCPSLPGAPAGTQPLPSAAQLAYQRTEMTAFIHYSMATYDGTEQGNPADSPSIFNPTNLNATTVNAWVTSLKAAGFRQSMLVTKHSVGFCLWPSSYTTYSVKSSPWMNGAGDIVQLWSDAMHQNGMRPALYLAPWDQKYTSSSSTYQTYFENQISELFAYGDAYEIEFDGYNAPTSGNVDWKAVAQYIKKEQPDILIWAGPEIVKTGLTPDLQWIGNENGQATRTTSSLNTANCGGGTNWCPYECNISSHRPNWFWHPNQNPIALSDMQSVYFSTVGMNCTLNFNVPPSQTGEFDPKDLSLLQQFGSWYSALYQTNVTKAQPVTADSTWATAGFESSNAVDDDVCTYWAAASGKTTGRLEVTPASPITVKLISIREAIELGERVKSYHVEFKQNGNWVTAPTDKSGTQIKGTVIGQRQLWQVNSTSVQAIALVVDSAKDVPAIAEFDVY
jgi:alpha-L-fucosidase